MCRTDLEVLRGELDLVLAPARVVHRLPEHVSFEAGVLVEPAKIVLERPLAL